MNKTEVKDWLLNEMNVLTSVSKDFHKNCLLDRIRCTKLNIDLNNDKDYQTNKSLQRQYEAKAKEVLYILEGLQLITHEEQEKMFDELIDNCHAYNDYIK